MTTISPQEYTETVYNTTEMANISKNFAQSQEYQIGQQVTVVFMFYVLPVIIFVGFVANVVSIIIFFGKELRKFSSSVYVLAVLFADTGFLVSLLFVWLEVLGYGINHTVGMCQFLVYFTYVCSFLSVWYMVCITVENYITICHPTRIKDMCTQKRARIVTVALALGPAILYSITLFANAVRSDPQSGLQRCDLKPDFILMNYIITYIDSILTLLVPSLAMTLLLIAIVIAIFHSLRIKRKRIIKGSKLQKKMDKCPQVRVAKMLFALSVTYLILNIPSHIIRLYYLLRPLDTSSSHQISFTEGMIHHIFLHVSYLSCSIKFFLLYAFSSNFRKRIREFFPCFVYTLVSNGYPTTTVSNV